MGTMNLHIYGREYTIACDDGQEAHLGRLGQIVNERVKQLAQQMGRGSESLMLMYAALMLADELEEMRAHSKELRQQLEAVKQQGSIPVDTTKLDEMEAAMADSMNQIAARIEKIAGKLG
ncbi:MAG: cell division protein ZapA [Rickettsiales bacterium]|mgnify:CR=1 FL=1|nr:cell division protein ZapA [Rickettsiales bacterium]|tara:strand:- start:85 stop:444 length:360 start_codon:yes stop_codon:yes gene_type:complete